MTRAVLPDATLLARDAVCTIILIAVSTANNILVPHETHQVLAVHTADCTVKVPV